MTKTRNFPKICYNQVKKIFVKRNLDSRNFCRSGLHYFCFSNHQNTLILYSLITLAGAGRSHLRFKFSYILCGKIFVYIFVYPYFSTSFVLYHYSAILRDLTPPNLSYIFQVILHFGSSILFNILYC